MQVIIDANVLFAALIKDSITLEIIVNGTDEFFTPEYILEEFDKHKEEILKKTKRSSHEFEILFGYLKERISIVPKDEYIEKLNFAESVSPDIKDAPYIALTLKLKIPIWSNDKDLKEKQNTVKVFSTKDILS
ncbi:MAG: PIN domain-containing protein [Candidatus Micrarchaeota archaeon]|nr:PIN domain-containing protein [Candidatus Micrarchaeota archaeon]